MHSYADRRTHDFFFERDYPDVKILDGIFARLGAEAVEKAVLQKTLRIEGEVFDKALEKLWIHGGAVVDFAENVSRGQEGWRELYVAQSEQKQQQLDLMLRFAEVNECRMAAVVRHFGDLADSRNACGLCDFCEPDDCVAQRYRAPRADEIESAKRAIDALRGGPRATGKLHGELFGDGSVTRDDFEEILGSMARSGLVRIVSTTFEKDGRSIPYRKAGLTSAGEAIEEDETPEFQMKVSIQSVRKRKKKPKAEKKKAKKGKNPPVAAEIPKAKPASPKLEEALRAWRLAEARRRGVPAFRILADAALTAIAERRPSTAAELLAIPGIGMKALETYGSAIYRLVAQSGD